MGYIGAEAKRRCRERWHAAVVTHLKEKMKRMAPFESETQATCSQGQPLQWRGYDERWGEHEFVPAEPAFS